MFFLLATHAGEYLTAHKAVSQGTVATQDQFSYACKDNHLLPLNIHFVTGLKTKSLPIVGTPLVTVQPSQDVRSGSVVSCSASLWTSTFVSAPQHSENVHSSGKYSLSALQHTWKFQKPKSNKTETLYLLRMKKIESSSHEKTSWAMKTPLILYTEKLLLRTESLRGRTNYYSG